MRLPESKAEHAGVPSTAQVLLEYGAEKEGYCNSDRFIKNVKNSIAIAKYKYPARRNTVVFILYQSSCHRAFCRKWYKRFPDECASGGKQPCMRDTVWAGRVQRMVRDNGVVKGLKAVLDEQGINTEGMKGDDMRTVLSFHDDFVNELPRSSHK